MSTLTAVIHGDSGVGKSWFGDTVPGPRLILDVEGGTRYTKSRKVKWDPRTAPNDLTLTENDSAVVRILEFGDLSLVVQWLRSGQHPFKSVVIDSLTEAQTRCMKGITGPGITPETSHWGRLLIDMKDLVMDMKDLRDHPTNPLQAVIFICGSQEKSGKVRPHVQGQLQLSLPYQVDVLGYLYVMQDETGALRRMLLIQPRPNIDAKDRTDDLTQTFGDIISDPDVPKLLAALEVAEQAKAAEHG